MSRRKPNKSTKEGGATNGKGGNPKEERRPGGGAGQSVLNLLVRDTGTFSYDWPAGSTLDFDSSDLTSMSIPGAMIYDVVPTIGHSNSVLSPINIASRQMYNFIRHDKSGSSRYDAPDMGIYCVALANVYAFLNWLRRSYQLSNVYTAKNRYFPEAVVFGTGVDFNMFAYNRADFRAWFNMATLRVAKLHVPAAIPLFGRMATMYTEIFGEGPSLRDQIYMLNPAGFYFYKLNSDGSGALEFRSLTHLQEQYSGGKPLTLEALELIFDEFVAPILMDEDFCMMSGDIIHAYGPEALIKLSLLSEEETISHALSLDVLDMFRNAEIVPLDLSDISITQDTENLNGYLRQEIDPTRLASGESKLEGALTLSILKGRKALTTYNPEPTSANTYNNSRWCYSVSNNNKLISGSEVICNARILRLNEQDNYSPATTEFHMVDVLHTEDGFSVSVSGYIHKLWYFMEGSRFTFHPAVYFASGNFESSTPVYPPVMVQQLDNYTLIDRLQVERMHEVTLLNLFGLETSKV